MNSMMILTGSILILFLAYVIYGGWLSDRLGIYPRKGTPAQNAEGDYDFGVTSGPVAAGGQFAAMGGLGIIQGTILASVYGWLPALLWLLAAGIFLGGTQAFAGMFVSLRHGGASMGQIVEEYLGFRSGKWFQLLGWLSVVSVMAILLHAISSQLTGIYPGEDGMLVQNVYGGAVSMAFLLLYPISIFIGFLNRLRCPVVITTILGLFLMAAGTLAGIRIPFYLEEKIWLGILMAGMILAAILPLWFLTQPKNYLGSLLTILLLTAAAAGIFLGRPEMSVPVFAGMYVEEQGMLPYLLVVLGVGVLSGYHSMAAAGLASRQLNYERNAKALGYGPVLLQCLLGVIVLVTVGRFSHENIAEYGNGLEAFCAGLLELFSSVLPGKDWVIPVRILILLVLAVMMLTALESCARVGRITFQDLAKGKKGKKNFLQNRLFAAIITVAAAFGVLWAGYEKPGLTLGIYLTLLVVPVCLSVMAWQKKMGRSRGIMWIPLVGSGLVFVVCTGYYLVEKMLIVLDEGVSPQTAGEFAEIFFLVMGVAAFLIFVIDGVRGNMKKRRIIFATGNAGKMREIHEILGDLDAEILSLKEAGIQADIEENGATFEENAIIKAKAICEMTGCLVLADDSGLEIDYLDKEPGVLSARYMGEDTPYTIKNQKLIDRLDGVPEEERTARFVCVIAAAYPEGKVLTTRGTMEGYIGYESRGENGFGYDPIFFLKEYGCSSAELSMEEKNKISHRGKALRAMKEKLV